MPQVRVAVRADVRVVIGIAPKEAEKLIEAVSVRRELRPVAEVPLPKHAGAIARVLQASGDGDVFFRQALLWCSRGHNLFESGTLLIEACRTGFRGRYIP